jgi:hypothetical protein
MRSPVPDSHRLYTFQKYLNNNNIIIRMFHSGKEWIRKRHDKVSTHLHYSKCKTLGIETTENWKSHIPKPVFQHEDITVLWNQGMWTDREVLASRPDIIIKNMKDEICFLLDVAIPSDRNIIQKEPEKKLKYENLSRKMQRMCKMKCCVILVSLEPQEL